MARLHCVHCDAALVCNSCGRAPDTADPIVGARGPRHRLAPFDPRRRGAWLTQRGEILIVLHRAHVEAAPAPTCRDIAEKLHRNPNQTCTRMGELRAQGLTRRNGRIHETSTETPADEWELTPRGLALFGIAPPPPPPAPAPL